MTVKKTINNIVFLTTLLLSAAIFGDHLNATEKNTLDDGGLTESKSYKTNLWIYKSIGGVTRIKSKKKKRSWKCAWLCKKRKKKNAESITIVNTYYAKVANIFLSPIVRNKVCTNASSCNLKRWGFGYLPAQDYPSDLGQPKVVGVITTHRFTVDGNVFVEVTSKGSHPENAASELPLIE